MKVGLTGGGTAGHVNPAVAIAEEILRKEPDSRVLFIGREGGKENRAAERAGLKIETLRVQGFKRRLFGGNLKALLLALKATQKAERILRAEGAELVIGTGGYVCWPVVRAAKRLGIKAVIHESNAEPGLVTRILSGRCDRILLGYKSAAKKLSRSAKITVVGNPLRRNFRLISRQNARKALGIGQNEVFIISFGGSGGAKMLNTAMIRFMKEMEDDKNIRHLHATGDRFYKTLSDEKLTKEGSRLQIVPYVEDMPTALAAADIAVTRAGALTLAELAYVGVASILIPSPNVTGNHQYENARVISEASGAILLAEGEGFYERLSEELSALIRSGERRRLLSRGIQKFSSPNAAEKIYREIKNLTSISGRES